MHTLGLTPICSRGRARCLQAEQCRLQPGFKTPPGFWPWCRMCRLQAVQCQSGEEQWLQTALGQASASFRAAGQLPQTLAHAACCRRAGHCGCPTGPAVSAQAAPRLTAHHSVYEALQRQPPLLNELVGHLELLHSVLLRDWGHNDACRHCSSVAHGSNSPVADGGCSKRVSGQSCRDEE